MATCVCCPNEVEPERIELLNSNICSICARNGVGQLPIPKGATFYNGDGTVEIQVMEESKFEEFARTVRARDNAHGCA